MKIGIIGSRTFQDYELLKEKVLGHIDFEKFDCIVSGGARGADLLGERLAEELSLEKLIFLPDWNKYGKKAGFIRNYDIVSNSDILFVFWDKKSKGTKNSLEHAKTLNKPFVLTLFEHGRFYI